MNTNISGTCTRKPNGFSKEKKKRERNKNAKVSVYSHRQSLPRGYKYVACVMKDNGSKLLHRKIYAHIVTTLYLGIVGKSFALFYLRSQSRVQTSAWNKAHVILLYYILSRLKRGEIYADAPILILRNPLRKVSREKETFSLNVEVFDKHDKVTFIYSGIGKLIYRRKGFHEIYAEPSDPVFFFLFW